MSDPDPLKDVHPRLAAPRVDMLRMFLENDSKFCLANGHQIMMYLDNERLDWEPSRGEGPVGLEPFWSRITFSSGKERSDQLIKFAGWECSHYMEWVDHCEVERTQSCPTAGHDRLFYQADEHRGPVLQSANAFIVCAVSIKSSNPNKADLAMITRYGEGGFMEQLLYNGRMNKEGFDWVGPVIMRSHTRFNIRTPVDPMAHITLHGWHLRSLC